MPYPLAAVRGNKQASNVLPPPVNTVAPSIGSTATIGTQINGDDGTWTNPQAFTYQWQRNTGSWGNISGATSKNYTPVDADFGYALRLVVTSGGVSANSNATNLTQEAPVQVLGSEVATNPDFSTYSGGFTGWTLSPGTYGGDPGVSQVDASGGAGTGAARLLSTVSLVLIQQNAALSAATFYEALAVMSARMTGTIVWRTNNATLNRALAAVGSYRNVFRSNTADNANLRGQVVDATIDRVSLKAITPNGQLVAPSANMRITQFFTLPVSPVAGDTVWLMPRISDFANGNYWVAVLEYTGSQWDIVLYSVASHTRTSRISVANIGSTNGIRITMNGDSITLETTTNSGANWTQRGSTITNSTYNTATGVNVLAASTVTLGNMQYEAA